MARVRLEDNSPRFDGTLTLSRPVAVAGASGRGIVATPWRASAKVKASPANALFEQLEYQYGPEARAIKLTGTAEMRFGKEPRFDSVLSARQVDLDRALALPEATGRLPLSALKAFIEPLASSYRPPFPVRLGIGVDAVTLASGTLQNLRGDLTLDNDGWDIEQLEFRAPGFAQLRLSGRVAAGQAVTFKGPAQIEASDPKTFVAWLEGRADASQRQAGLLRASGDVTVGAQEFAVERLQFEFDRKTVEGRFAYAGADGAKAPRLDAELKAGELDVDGVLAFARAALDGSAVERPRDVSLVVDIGRATLAGVDVKGVSGTFKLDPAGLTFDRVRIADLADASFSLNGRMEGALDAPRGTVTFDVDARGLDGTIAVLSKYLPAAAEPLRQAAPRIVPLKTQATLGIEPVISTNPSGPSKVKLALDGSAGVLRTKITAEAAGDLATLTLPEFRLDAQTERGRRLGAGRAARDASASSTSTSAPGTLGVVVRSAAGSDARVDARLNAGGLSANAQRHRAPVQQGRVRKCGRTHAAGDRHGPAAARRAVAIDYAASGRAARQARRERGRRRARRHHRQRRRLAGARKTQARILTHRESSKARSKPMRSKSCRCWRCLPACRRRRAATPRSGRAIRSAKACLRITKGASRSARDARR